MWPLASLCGAGMSRGPPVELDIDVYAHVAYGVSWSRGVDWLGVSSYDAELLLPMMNDYSQAT